MNWLAVIWPQAPKNLPLICPPAPSGAVQDPLGFYDNASVAAAFAHANKLSLAVVLATVLVCYLMTRRALGTGFVLRWTVFAAVAAGGCAATWWLVLRNATVTALANSCENNPDPFTTHLGSSLVFARAGTAVVWALAAYAVWSLLLTNTVGRSSAAGGLFHNRGCPWPRILKPIGE